MAEAPRDEQGSALGGRTLLPRRMHRFPKSDDGITFNWWFGPIGIVLGILGLIGAYNGLPFQGTSGNTSSSHPQDGTNGRATDPRPGSSVPPSNRANGGHEDDQQTVPSFSPRQTSGEKTRSDTVDDSHLIALRDTARAWRNRRRYEAPDVADVLHGLTGSDRDLADNDGYADDLQTLQSADELMQWPQRGFTSKTPVYLFTDSPERNDIRIVDLLRNELAGSVHFVDEQHAALFIEIGNTDMRPQTERSADDDAMGHTSFVMTARWLNGNRLFNFSILKNSTDSSGTGNTSSNEDGALASSISQAIADAVRRVRGYLRH